MPNWCWTNYVIDGDEKEIADLYQKMQSLEKMETSLVKNDFGTTWLGNLVTLFGGDYNRISCCGQFMDLEKQDDSTIHFDTETAWADMKEVWNFVCLKYKSLRYYFIAEESGCCYYVTNDSEGKYFPERFLVEQDDADRVYHESDAALFKDIAERTGVPIDSKTAMENAIKFYNAENKGNAINVYEYDMP